MRYPWVPITLAFVAGILLSSRSTEQIPFLLAIAGIATLAALILTVLGKRTVAFLCALLAFANMGMVLITRATVFSDPDHISALEQDNGIDFTRIIEIEGMVAEHPAKYDHGLRLIVDIRRLDQSGVSITASGRIQLYVNTPGTHDKMLSPFRSGDNIRFFSHLRKPTVYNNPGGFDYAEYLRRFGITHTAAVNSPLAVEILNRSGVLDPSAVISSVKAEFEEIIQQFFSDSGGLNQKGALLEALLLGNRGRIEEETIAPLRRAGLMHIIAISGYHVWVLSLICFGLLRLTGLNDRWTSSITALVIIFYWGLTGGRSSIGRASIIALLFLLGKIFQKKSFPANNLAFAALAILLLNPTEIYSAGFQLTFAAVISILICYRRIVPFLRPLGLAGPLLAVSISAQLGVIPLTAYHFNMVNVHSILSSIVVLPMVSLVILLGFTLLLIGHFIPFLAELLAGLISFNIGILLESVELLDRVLPFSIRLPAPPVWLIVSYYICLAAWAVAQILREKREAVDELPATLNLVAMIPAAIALLLLVVNPFHGPPTGFYRLHAIDVGQGESLLLELADGSAALIDSGGTPMSDFDIGESVVSPFLWHRGHRSIDLVMATHGHSDHVEGLNAVLRNFTVGQLWLPRGIRNNEDVAKLLDTANRRGTAIRYIGRGDEVRWRSTSWRFFNPPSPPYTGKDALNNNSLVCSVRIAGKKVLFTGDAEARALEEIIRQYGNELHADILKVPHHGSDDALNAELLELVRPRVAVISAGRNNLFNFPRPLVLRELKKHNILAARTDEKGWISILISGDSITVETQVARDRNGN